MNRSIKTTVLLVSIVLGGIFFLRFVVGGSEDSWICDNNHWIKHGKPAYPMPENPCGQKIVLPKTAGECEKIGGVWARQGPEPFESCNIKALDKGNICHDSSDCQGMCQVDLSSDELSAGMRGNLRSDKKYGQCSVWVVELGCMGIMKDGVAQVICID
jgi:hypothetical protein